MVDAYGNPVHLMISEGQRNDIVYAIPLLEQVKIPEGSQILADRGYDSENLRFRLEKVQNFNGIVTGGFIKNATL